MRRLGGARRRANFAFGTGSARVEAESFQGSIIRLDRGMR